MSQQLLEFCIFYMCGLLQNREVASTSYVLHVRFVATKRCAETPHWHAPACVRSHEEIAAQAQWRCWWWYSVFSVSQRPGYYDSVVLAPTIPPLTRAVVNTTGTPSFHSPHHIVSVEAVFLTTQTILSAVPMIRLPGFLDILEEDIGWTYIGGMVPPRRDFRVGARCIWGGPSPPAVVGGAVGGGLLTQPPIFVAEALMVFRPSSKSPIWPAVGRVLTTQKRTRVAGTRPF